MFIEERHAAILSMLYENKSITTADIQKKFGISYDSAKRDLRILEEKGALKRTHGGAVPVGELSSASRIYSQIQTVDDADMPYICRRAAELIEDGDTVFLPCSSIGFNMAHLIKRDSDITVVTNSVPLAEAVRRRGGISLFLIGGGADQNGICRDAFSTELVKRIRIKKAFISTDTLSPEFGLSCADTADIQFTAALIDSSSTTVGIYGADSMDKESRYSICTASCLDILITDAKLGARIAEYKKLGIKRIICQ